MKAVIVDDEPILAKAVATLLNKFFPEISVAGTAGSVADAVTVIKAAQPDILLLDIDIKEGTGFDVLDQLRELKTKVVFITAYDEFALKAFKYNAMDYILKPIDPDEFQLAIKKCLDTATLFTDIGALLANAQQQPKRIMLNSAKEIIPVFVDDIVYVAAEGSYSKVVLENDRQVLTSKSMKHYTDTLDPTRFVRVNHSNIINIAKVTKYTKGVGGSVVLSSGDTLEVSRRRKADLMKLLG